MTLPAWMLLAFATWTVILLLVTVGVYRWTLILTRRVPISAFRADRVEGHDFYHRAMRAHANCVENLPVFAAIVFALHAAGAVDATTSVVCVAIVASRVAHSLVHVSVRQGERVVFVRFFFYLLQVAGFLWLAGNVVATLA